MFYVYGNGNVFSTGQYSIPPFSAECLYDNNSESLIDDEEALATILGINGYTYQEVPIASPEEIENNEYVDEAAVEGMKSDFEKRKVSLSAENLAEVFPDAVRTDPQARLCIDYNAVVTLLTQAMKKFVYLCGMMLLYMNIMAQDVLDDDGYCYTTKIKGLSCSQPGSILPVTPGWRKYQAFSDDFDATQLNTNIWYIRDMYIHENHTNVGYINSPTTVHVENGKLYLTLTPNTDNIVFPSYNYSIPTYLSGWVKTNNQIRYGYIETECYLPSNSLYMPCLWTTNSYQPWYGEVDVFEKAIVDNVSCPEKLRQNCYAKKNGIRSDLTQLLTFPQSLTGNSFVFGVEILPKEVVFYINGRVTSHVKYNDHLFNDWNTYTCTDMEELPAMNIVLSLTCHTPSSNAPTLPQNSTWFEYVHSYKLERGETDTYHPTTFVPSDESTKVYPHVILGGTGCTANVNTSTAIWAEQDIVLDKGFELSANTPFSARVISVPDTIHSHLYINKR